MSRTTCRVISWLAMLILAAGIWVGWRHVPGVNGPQEELYWLLDHDKVPPQHLNLGGNIIRFAEDRQPGRRAALFRSLLLSGNEHLVDSALALLASQVEPPGKGGGDLRQAFADWFAQASVEQKVAHLRVLLQCCLFASTNKVSTPDPNAYEILAPGEWDLAVTRDDWRWLIAATLSPQRMEAHVVDMAVFPIRMDTDNVVDRLRYLDGINPSYREKLDAGKLARINRDHMRRQLRVPIDDLTRMLDDPIREVRWGAGRIFAVAGDRRGLPALRDWLKEHPTRARACDELMTPLFGPNWRSDVESGSATSQPRAGDGGG